MPLTQPQLAAAVVALTTQMNDLIQANLVKVLGINKKAIELAPGTSPMSFESAYDVGVTWTFTFIKAVNANGVEVDYETSNSSRTGFDITVQEQCTLYFKAESFNLFISD